LLAPAALAVMIFMMTFAKRVPGAIVALAGGTAAVVLFELPVETIGSRFGGIPAGLRTSRFRSSVPICF
jgi:SulP family sulfate permease